MTNSVNETAAGTGGRLNGRTVVMTGATSGLGAVAAETLAARGARLVIVARDPGRAEATLERLRRANRDAAPTVHLADLSRLADVRRITAAIAAAEPRVDVLANNAGAFFGHRVVTQDGLERTFATNHLAPFVMTLGLLPALRAAGAARVITTASGAHRTAQLPARDIQSLEHYAGWRAYARSKLYNILFTRELARRWAGWGIAANCFHPGFVATRFGDGGGGWLEPLLRLAKHAAITPAQGAGTLIHLAAAPEVARVTGRYFYRCALSEPTRAARDDAAAAALWSQSLALAGIADPSP